MIITVKTKNTVSIMTILMLLVFIVCHVLLSTLLLLSWIEMCLLCSSNSTRDNSIHGHHQIVNTEIRLIIFFAAKNGKALYSQQKQDRELTVAQIMNSLLPNSDLN